MKQPLTLLSIALITSIPVAYSIEQPLKAFKKSIAPLKISPYASLRVSGVYQDKQEKVPFSPLDPAKQRNNSHWELKDNASKAGIKFSYPLAGHKLYGRFELGTNANSDDQPFFKIRQAYMGIKTQWGRLQYGQQNAIVKNYDDFDRSHRVGASVHLTKDELNTKRPEQTLQYHYDADDFRLSAQYNFARQLDKRPQLRVGSQRLRVSDTELDYGVGYGVTYRGLKHIELEAGYQNNQYPNAKYYTNVASAKWKVSRDLQLSAYGAQHVLEDHLKGESAESRHYALGARYKLFDNHRVYGSLEYAKGYQAIEGGKQRALVLGNDYKLGKNKHVYVEMRKRYFDADKADDLSAAVGINMSF
ncbi:porin [Bowmanella pacifica]|uniref:Porin domain-containing protein n=1 Tax=Bowmanella pacifica TaxID=502051 RepID=A0A918DMG6_9ALTE|nr:porin [Bowmanella pacifica]GGO74071.1 hypothetical protein GCM10010982_36020 [Bowmanella pacifica]